MVKSPEQLKVEQWLTEARDRLMLHEIEIVDRESEIAKTREKIAKERLLETRYMVALDVFNEANGYPVQSVEEAPMLSSSKLAQLSVKDLILSVFKPDEELTVKQVTEMVLPHTKVQAGTVQTTMSRLTTVDKRLERRGYKYKLKYKLKNDETPNTKGEGGSRSSSTFFSTAGSTAVQR